MTYHKSALALAEQAADRYQQAESLAGIGKTFHTMGDVASAEQHLETALAIFTDLGVPEAEQLRGELRR